MDGDGKTLLLKQTLEKGFKFPTWARIYVTFFLPLIVITIFFQGYMEKFSQPLNILLPIVILLLVIYIPLQAWIKKSKS